MSSIVLESSYGYVLGTAILSAFYLVSLSMKSGKARNAANVPYPYAYATKEEAQSDPKKHIFNCTQRVHQNTLEAYPVYMTLLLIGGISHPIVSAVAGLVWIAGRIGYGSGYTTGDPAKRSRGAFGYLGLLTLLGTSFVTVYHTLC
ncbi:hypothetical protein BDF14DRAFT_1760497 [Spinellus fusiger]|nr:hypothetical protein BDF14DRAFT_1760497 [Spinellus fusiger]